MDKIEVYRDEDGELRWRFVRHGNHERMANGGEGYKSVDDLEAALLIVFAPSTVGRAGGRLSYLVRRTSTLHVLWMVGE